MSCIKKPGELELEMKHHPPHTNEEAPDRIAGSLLGLALGDALGAHVSYEEQSVLQNNRVRDLGFGGTWGLEKGEVAVFEIYYEFRNNHSLTIVHRCHFRLSVFGHFFDCPSGFSSL